MDQVNQNDLELENNQIVNEAASKIQPTINEVVFSENIEDEVETDQRKSWKKVLALAVLIITITGLAASMVLIRKNQELRKQAMEDVKVSAESRCANARVQIQITVYSANESYLVTATDLQSKKSLEISNLVTGRFNVGVIETDMGRMNADKVMFDLDSDTVGKLKVDAWYKSLDCRGSTLGV